MSIEADYVIVGGGLSGCALASRIKQLDPSSSVLILEAGSDPLEKHDVVTAFGGFALAGSELDWQYKTTPVLRLDRREFNLAAGKTLGGGSMLNYGGWSRGSAEDYNDWARKLKDKRWSYQGLLPYMKRSETFRSDANSEEHGYSGPFTITSVRDRDPKQHFPLAQPIEAAWAEIGVSPVKNPCSGDLDGLNEYYENFVGGKRQPSQLKYNLAGVEIVTGTPVNKVILSQDSIAKGVELNDGRHIHTRGEVILSAGTFATPTILLRSGIHLPGVGENYSDHFAIYQLWKVKDPERGLAIGHPKLSNPVFCGGLPMDWVANEAPPREDMEKALDIDGVKGAEREAILTPGRTYIETMILYMSMFPNIPSDGTYITTSILLTVPTSRGRVSLSPIDPNNGQPHIIPNYFSTAFDRLCLTHGVKRIAQLMSTTSMAPYISHEVPPPGMDPITKSSSDAEITARIHAVGMPHCHAMGTCAMGEVINSDLKVHGVKGLRICDASIFPSPVGGHPMATLYAVAEQAAEMIVGKGAGSSVDS